MRNLSLLALALLSGCATAPVAPVAVAPPPPPGMELLLAKPPELALSMLGDPRLDKREGPARQLQFAGACVLDIWYYPQPGPALSATYADARLVDGRDYSAGECLQMLLNARKLPDIAPSAPPKKPAQRRRG